MKRQITAGAALLLTLLLGACGEEKAGAEEAAQGPVEAVTEDTEDSMQMETSTEEEGSTFAVTLPTKAEDSPVYVGAVPDLPEDMILGMDASSVLAEENSGVKYYSFDGEEQDVFQTFAEAGINCIRLRVWNDPYDSEGHGYGGGNCDVDTAALLGARATRYGMSVCIDFHYSDFWADPQKQFAPKAWENMTYDEKKEALYDFTKESLTDLIDAGVDVSMVQIGNEINNGMAGEKSFSDIIPLLAEGSRAVREVSESCGKDIDVVVHLTEVTNPQKVVGLVQSLEDADLDYDVLGLSYYPFWDGPVSGMQDLVRKMKDTSGKRVVIAETSYCYTMEDGDGFPNSVSADGLLLDGYPASVQGQTSMIRDTVNAAVEAGCEGVFYWEGAWIPVGPADQDNSEIWEKYGSGWASSYAASYDPDDAGKYYGGSSWDNQAFFDFDGNPLPSLNVWKYLRYGTTKESAVEEVTKEETQEEETEESDTAGLENLLFNPGFEDADTSMWQVAYEGTNPTDYQDRAVDAHSGSIAFHFWSENDMEFSLEQTVTGLPSGTYTLEAYAQGGDTDESASFVLYARTSDGEEKTCPYTLTSYRDWQHPVVEGIGVTDGTLTIGIRAKTNAQSWGTVDDFGLYQTEE